MTSFQVGDYVTAVYLPGKFPKSLRLVGFLDLLPDSGLAPRLPPPGAKPDWRALLMFVAFVAWCAGMFWNVYAMQKYEPVDFEFRQAIWPMLPGAAAAALVLAGAWLYRRRQQRRAEEDEMELGGKSLWARMNPFDSTMQLVTVCGLIVLGATATLSWSWRANAWLDDSRGELKTVEILGRRVQKQGPLRHYIVDYRLPGARQPRQYYTTPEHMANFANAVFGVAELHEGRFGWQWVKTLHPAAPGR
ncbi:MAG TPA: hypothetical protein VMV10_12995 [Pirellulales bacterium]|nr:hypothetical protein [Pirellulales bacterium]